MELEEMQKRFENLKQKRAFLKENQQSLSTEIEDQKERLIGFEKLRETTRLVAKQTQEQITFSIENLVNLALNAIPFVEQPVFSVEFVERRNTTECDLKLSNKKDVLESSGGGALDVVCFALRLAFWVLRKNRPVLIFDEPFRNLDSEAQTYASEMVKKLTKKLKLQIIMISHVDGIKKNADRVITINKGKASWE